MARTKALSVFWCGAPPLPGFRTSRLITRTLGGVLIPAAFSCAAVVMAKLTTLAAKHRQAPSNMVTTLFILCRPPRQRLLSGLLALKGRTEIPARENANWLGSAEDYSRCGVKSSEGADGHRQAARQIPFCLIRDTVNRYASSFPSKFQTEPSP